MLVIFNSEDHVTMTLMPPITTKMILSSFGGLARR